jgi:hypothetical protein
MSDQFHPPGGLTDFDGISHQRDAWHVAMATFFAEAIARTEVHVGRGRSQLFDPTKTHPGGPVAEQTITWNGFPKALLAQAGSWEEALRAAEQLISFTQDGRVVKVRPQDEYLEWHVMRDAAGRIVAVDFTCEGPEYWAALAHGYPDSVSPRSGAPAAKGDMQVVLALYHRYVSPAVKLEELVHAGHYDPVNQWNTQRGAMHLTHPSNSLQAEVFLAGDATVLRERDSQVLEDDDELIRCAQYGEPARASDPTIGGGVNALVRAGALVSLRDPVGLYIDSLDTTGWTKPDGLTPVGDYWKVLRGQPDAIVRARYEVPPSEGFSVSEILIGGEPIAFAGQIAERITMKLTGIAAEQGQHRAAPVACEAPVQQMVGAGSEHAELVHVHVRSHGSG